MIASDEAASQGARPRTWLVLIHQLPPKPDYLRVKIRRRLQGIGAAQLKPTVYILPDDDESLEDAHWLIREIRSLGGTAVLTRSAFLDGISSEEIEAMLKVEQAAEARPETRPADRIEPGRTWVTRTGVKVDRIASAWLIRRFVDPAASFKFVPATGYTPTAGELRFDMFEAEYTHEGERCTFQTLVARFALADTALAMIGEIVHDIDCKDQQFGRPETEGVAALIRGIAAATDDDDARLSRGAVLFEGLYQAFSPRSR